MSKPVKVMRLLLGAMVSIGIVLLADWATTRIGGPPHLVAARSYLWLAMVEPGSLFLASLVGACIARSNFMLPALFVALGVWLLTDSFFDAFARVAECGLFFGSRSLAMITLVVTVSGSLAGAWLGKRMARATGAEIASDC